MAAQFTILLEQNYLGKLRDKSEKQRDGIHMHGQKWCNSNGLWAFCFKFGTCNVNESNSFLFQTICCWLENYSTKRKKKIPKLGRQFLGSLDTQILKNDKGE